ncbi:MAG: 1-(5-phosphoribosyl)-5-[(5-phosphoribosylamino)methylideneamino] imidazole-4-carboxamide isomerase [Brevinematales bacterium]|nr:1-(5-phosphoribosyl)-5-[(5-phosphoribosylamino)methylideneamino] imidazole-4-carboxamide isomerase [Brevinematales bacterium]
MKFIIPAVDIYDNKVVRLTRGDFSQATVYSDDPIGVIRDLYSKGFRRLHLVDLEGAKTGEIKTFELIKTIKNKYKDLILQFGGGVRSYEIAENIINAGADYVIIGTMFIKKPEEFKNVLNKFRERVILSLDINVDKIVIHGWQSDVEISVEEAFDKALRMGVTRIMSTDITRDGTLLGPDIRFITSLLETLKQKHLNIVVEEIMKIENIQHILKEGIDILTKGVNEFMETLKNPRAGNYELKQKLDEYDKAIDTYKESLIEKLPLKDILQKYPKPYLIISGGVSSDSDIDDILKINNGFLEGIIVGKSLYEGRITFLR